MASIPTFKQLGFINQLMVGDLFELYVVGQIKMLPAVHWSILVAYISGSFHYTVLKGTGDFNYDSVLAAKWSFDKLFELILFWLTE